MGSFSHDARGAAARPRERLARHLAARCPNPKILAREIGVTPKQAENLLAGHWPGDLTWAAIVRRFGEDVWRAVFLPEIAPALAALLDEERRLNEQLAAARGRRRQMEGNFDGVADAATAAPAAGIVEALREKRAA